MDPGGDFGMVIARIGRVVIFWQVFEVDGQPGILAKRPVRGFWAPRGSPGRFFKHLGAQKADFGGDHTKRLVMIHIFRENQKNFENAIFGDFSLRGLRGGIMNIGRWRPYLVPVDRPYKNGLKWPKLKNRNFSGNYGP